ncbi:hypothetical protein VPHD479_0364 [Vibrio phage D479]
MSTTTAQEYIHSILHTPLCKPQINVHAYGDGTIGGFISQNPKHKYFQTFLNSPASIYKMYVVTQPDNSGFSPGYRNHRRIGNCYENPWAINAKKMIEMRADYAKYRMMTADDFKYDVEEPAIAIIDKMINTPTRFHIATQTEGFRHGSSCVIVDKDTQVKFVAVYNNHIGRFEMTIPSCFTETENRVIANALWFVVCRQRQAQAAKQQKREEKRKQAFRDELMQQYT